MHPFNKRPIGQIALGKRRIIGKIDRFSIRNRIPQHAMDTQATQTGVKDQKARFRSHREALPRM